MKKNFDTDVCPDDPHLLNRVYFEKTDSDDIRIFWSFTEREKYDDICENIIKHVQKLNRVSDKFDGFVLLLHDVQGRIGSTDIDDLKCLLDKSLKDVEIKKLESLEKLKRNGIFVVQDVHRIFHTGKKVEEVRKIWP